jgi:hypothetical protein
MMQQKAEVEANDSYWRRLLHRWFVEYNPLYLVSATLVLGGMIVSSRGLASEGSVYGEIGVAAIAELYSLALIGGAAILMRLQHRRSAVMLALLTVLYQCDLTLHTETCPNLGDVGVAASIGWLALFIGKLAALGWAMKLRVSRAMMTTAITFGIGLAVLPYALQRFESRSSNALVAMWLFALVALQQHARVTSKEDDLSEWGLTVLRRSMSATWALWASLGALHVLFWSSQYHSLNLAAAALPIVPLALVRFVRRETRVWALVATTLLMTALRLESMFSVTAFLGAVTLAMRAWLVWKTPDVSETVSAAVTGAEPVTPYRFAGDVPVAAREAHMPSAVPTIPLPPVIPTGTGSLHRLMCGSLLAMYLSMWTFHWVGGEWPAHILSLDVGVAVVLALAAWRLRARIAFVPLSIGFAQAVVASQILPRPQTMVGWGAMAIGSGFVLLIVSIAASYYLRETSASQRGAVLSSTPSER